MLWDGGMLDITERKHVETALVEVGARRKILLDESRHAIFVVSTQCRLLEWIGAFRRMLGYTEQEMPNLYVSDFDAQWSSAQLLKRLQDLLEPSETFEPRHRRKDGTICDVEVSAGGVHMLVFPRSNPQPHCVPQHIAEAGQRLLKDWGGEGRLRTCAASFQ